MASHHVWRRADRNVPVKGGQESTVEDCIFCKIARGELPARIVYKDDLVVAFDDIAPQAPVHTLIIPRSHHEGPGDDLSPELMAALCSAIPKVAEAKGIAGHGYRVIMNVGRDARQSVAHMHLHVLGGRPMSHHMLNFAD
jgi:histidine triad (HIT) family protein